MKYLIHDNESVYRKWLFHPETKIDAEESCLTRYSAKIVKITNRVDWMPTYALEFSSKEHLLLFKLRYE